MSRLLTTALAAFMLLSLTACNTTEVETIPVEEPVEEVFQPIQEPESTPEELAAKNKAAQEEKVTGE